MECYYFIFFSEEMDIHFLRDEIGAFGAGLLNRKKING